MAEKSILAFKCLNGECGQTIKLPRPEKSGIYNVTCPHCGVTKQLKLRGLDAIGGATAGNGKADETPAVPDNSAKPVIEIEDDFVVGVKYKIRCPHCGKVEFGFVTEKPGHRAIPCPRCKGKCGVDVRKKTEVILVTDQLQLIKGKLVLLRKGWLNKDYRLHEGRNIIGRYDESAMSDIAIKNDPSMSRRSVQIDVMHTEKGYTFKLTVLKSLNPVLHNNNPLMAGESISLNFGDTIVMGKTRFRFDKDI